MSLAALIPVVGNIIDKIIPDKQKAAEAKLKMMELEQQGEFQEEEYRYRAITEEAKSSDPWTSRARPSFLYVMYIMILASLPVGFASVFFPGEVKEFVQGFQGFLRAIPGELYGLFAAGYLGYTVKRSADKKAVLGNKEKSLLEKIF